MIKKLKAKLQEKNKKLKVKLQEQIEELSKTHSTPHEIAIGFAIGILIAILPTPGISVLLAALVILIYKRVNKFSLFGALAVFNPFTMIPFYIASFAIGDMIFGTEEVVLFKFVFLNTVYNYTRRYLIGNLIVAIVTAIIGYIVMYIWFKIYYKKKNKVVIEYENNLVSEVSVSSIDSKTLGVIENLENVPKVEKTEIENGHFEDEKIIEEPAPKLDNQLKEIPQESIKEEKVITKKEVKKKKSRKKKIEN